ncbi:MAG: RNA polymerase sigma factor [Acidimicrobiales bacterium]
MFPPPQSPTDGPTSGADSGDGEDRALIARIARGDRGALEQLYRRHAPWLIPRLESRCGDPDLADLALQDTFVSVWQSAKRYRGDGQVGAWLWGIAVRRLIDQLRKRRPTPMSPETMQRYDRAMSFEDTLVDNGSHGRMGVALRTLEPDLQTVLIATAIDGLTTKEAARALGIPQGTVKTRLMRARKHLQEILA